MRTNDRGQDRGSNLNYLSISGLVETILVFTKKAKSLSTASLITWSLSSRLHTDSFSFSFHLILLLQTAHRLFLLFFSLDSSRCITQIIKRVKGIKRHGNIVIIISVQRQPLSRYCKIFPAACIIQHLLNNQSRVWISSSHLKAISWLEVNFSEFYVYHNTQSTNRITKKKMLKKFWNWTKENVCYCNFVRVPQFLAIRQE